MPAHFDTSTWPPHGWRYREPKLNWEVRGQYAMLPFAEVVRMIQLIRIQNPSANLDPNYEACELALKLYTEARVKDDRWSITDKVTGKPTPAPPKPKCKTCGKKKGT